MEINKILKGSKLRSSDPAIKEMASAGQCEAFDLVAKKPIDPIPIRCYY